MIPFIFQPVAEPDTVCKVCDGPAPLYGVVDFNKYCAFEPTSLPISGIPVYYYRCRQCGFIFTRAFDEFTNQDFLERIYNAGYENVDPDYTGKRPRENLQRIITLFGNTRQIRILDYGGGSGLLTRLLREAGFSNAVSFDPFVEEYSRRPEGRFDLVVSFEVLEHSPSPRETIADIDSFLLEPAGMVFFSTLIQSPDTEKAGTTWWYIAPRNGHCSIHTQVSLRHLGNPHRLTLGSMDMGTHVYFRDIPPFARHLFKG
jgi:2-polyprenyl-6-hydroxyphenyl methylase/3-demethylubiquinone-9 3-methyltransferase